MNKLIYFTASWCGPCKMFSPVMDKASSLGIPIQKVDIDQNKPLAIQYQIRSVPTVIKVDQKGNVLNRMTGARSLEEVKRFYNG